jgi:hypothetical protein
VPSTVHAIAACTAQQVSSQDPNCPAGTGPCNIAFVFEIGDGCTLDFGARAVTVLSTGELDVQSNTATVRAGSFTIAPGGRVEGRGNQSTAPRNRGGMLTIQTTGAFAVQRSGASRGVVDFSGNARGGTFTVEAGGAITINGEVMANGLTATGGNGGIRLIAGGDVVTGAQSALQATGGLTSSGGFIDIRAGGRVDLGTALNVGGGDGGVADVLAGADAIVRGIAGTGAGDAGSGGCASVTAGTSVQVLAAIVLNGTGSPTLSGGGCGGFIDIDSRFGDTTISAPISAESGPPDGGGGGVGVTARGSIFHAAGAPLSVQGIGLSSCGGELALEAGFDVTSNDTLNASGGFGGNLIDVIAGRNVTLNGMVDARGRNAGSFGGSATIVAGERGQGNVAINSTVDVGGGACGPELGCGLGGFAEITGCNVTVAGTAIVDVRAAEGGDNLLVAREKLTVLGPVRAATTGGGDNGTNTLQHPSRVAPTITAGVVTPTPVLQARNTCTATGQTGCLVPCPQCGNGMVEFPETCDQAGATPVNCDGCASNCRVQNCNDGSLCTADSCDATLGCRNQPVNEGMSCTDNNVCNGVEVCTAGACRAPAPGPNCADTNPCTNDVCHPTLGCQHPASPLNTPCTDGNSCTVGDVCNGMGACTPGQPQVCADTNPCTTDTCAPALGCVFSPIPGCSTTTTTLAPGQTTTSTAAPPTTTSTSLPPPTTTSTSVPPPTTTSTSVPGVSTTSTTVGGGTTTSTSVAPGTTTSTSLAPGATTTTSTSAPRPSTTSTTLAGTCVPASCDDGNGCTTDLCQGGSCVHQADFDGVVCDLAKLLVTGLCGGDPIPKKLQRTITLKAKKARTQVGKAENNTKNGAKLVGRAAAQLASLRTSIQRYGDRGKITPACRATLDRLVGGSQTLLSGLGA